MAKTLSSASIATSNTILAWHVTQSVDALTGTDAYDITISGSLQTTGSVGISGLLSATPGITHQLTASNAVSSSYAATASFASSVPPGVGSKWSGSNPITRDGNVEITGSLTVSGSGGKYIITQRLQSYNNGDSSNFIAGLGAGGNLTQYPNDNVVIGYNALDAQTGLNADSYNVVIGSQAASDVNVSEKFGNNVMIGYAAGFKAQGGDNVAIGSEALKANAGSANPSQSIAIGRKALEDIQNANGNIAIGYYVGESTMVQGDENIFIGNYVNSSGYGGIDTSKQLKIGYKTIIPLSASLETGDVLFPSTASAAYFSGDGSNLTGISAGLWTGSSGTITRESDVEITGSLIVSGSNSYLRMNTSTVAIGYGSSTLDDWGSNNYNTYLGAYAGKQSRNLVEENVGIGYKALESNYNGDENVAIGFEAISQQSSPGNWNVGVGFKALRSSNAGNSNTAVGHNAVGGGSISGTGNVVLGYRAGYSLTSANQNIFIGYETGDTTSFTGDNNILIGPGLETATASTSKDLRIGSSSIITISGSLATGDLIFLSTASAAHFSASGVVYGETGSFSHLQGNSPFTIGDQVTFQQPTTASRLLISGSTTSTLDTARLRVGNYFANGGAAVSQAEELYLSGSGVQRSVIESSDNSAVLQLRSPSGQATVIDFEEGGQQRWVIGVSASNENFIIATGSALSEGVLFQVNRTSKDVEITNNISASAVSASTYYGDGSNLSNISSTPFPFTGDAVITGSLTISGSFNSFKVESSNIVLGAGAGANMTSAATNNVIIGTNAGDAGVTGDKNVFLGEAAGGGNTSGNYNTYVGYQAGLSKDTESENVIIGYRAGEAGAASQVAIGYFTGNPNTQDQNIAIGKLASRYSVSGRNTSIGYSAGLAYAAGGSVSVGYYAAGGGNGNDKSAGEHNVAIGDYTLYGDSTNGQDGSGNIALGYYAGKDIETGDGNIIIGSGSLGSAAISNQLRIGHNGTHIISGSLATGDVIFASTASAAYFSGDGSKLTNLPVSSLWKDETTYISSSVSIKVDGNITASGNISSSSDVQGASLTTDQYIKHNGDTDTYISFLDDEIRFEAGNLLMFDIHKKGSAPHEVTVNEGGNNVDFLIEDDSGDTYFIADASTTRVGIGSGNTTPSATLHVSGGGTTNVLVEGDITTTNLIITSSGTVLPSIESSDGIAALKLKSGGSHAYIDMDEGDAQRWIAGMYTNDNSYRIASGSAFASNTLFELDQDGKITVQSDISSSAASTASFGTYIGDGSQLSNISSTPFPFNGDAVITGSLLISGSGQFRMDSDDVVLGAGAGRALDSNTSNNILIGNKAGYDITSGDNNVILGQSAGENTNADADDNIILGYQAGYNAVSKNILIGTQAGQGGASYNNVIIGYQAGYSATSNTAYNVIIGYQAGFDTTGQYNTVIGYTAGQDIDAGDYNINIGYDVSSTSGTDNELLIGKQSVIAISASLTTGYLHDVKADGLNINGNALITGSLIVSSSNSTSSLSLQGSGSTVFDVAGSQGQLFSVTDDLSGTLFEANNISGLPVIQASADNTVHLGKWNGYGITISGSTPDPADVDAHIFITGSVHVSGSISNGGIVTLTNDPGAYTLGGGEHLVLVDAASGNVSITMPSASSYPGRQIFFKAIAAPGGNTISFSGSAAEKVEFSNKNVLTAFNDVSESISLVSDGTSNWYLF